MGKLVYILGFIAIAAASFLVTLYAMSPESLQHVVTDAKNIVSTIQPTLTSAWHTFTANPLVIFSVIGGLASVTGLALKAWSNVREKKAQAEQLLASTQKTSTTALDTLKAENATLNGKLAEANVQMGKYETQVAELQETAPNMAALMAERDSINKQLTDAMKTNTTLTQALAVKQNFTLSDLKALAAKMNCDVHEKVA